MGQCAPWQNKKSIERAYLQKICTMKYVEKSQTTNTAFWDLCLIHILGEEEREQKKRLFCVLKNSAIGIFCCTVGCWSLKNSREICQADDFLGVFFFDNDFTFSCYENEDK